MYITGASMEEGGVPWSPLGVLGGGGFGYKLIHIMRPRRRYPFYIVNYYIKYITTSWTYSISILHMFQKIWKCVQQALSNSHIVLTDKNGQDFFSYSTSKSLPVHECSVRSALKWLLPWNRNWSDRSWRRDLPIAGKIDGETSEPTES